MSKLQKGFLLFLIPLLVMQLLIYVIPIGSTIYYAFTTTTGLEAGQFTLTGNFGRVSKDLWPTIKRTLIWTFGSIVPSMVLGLCAAVLFNRKFRGQKVCISICLVPYTIPLIIVGVCWYFMYQPNFGLLNGILRAVGILEKPMRFLNKEGALLAVIVARIWRSMPFAFVSLYAAVKAIPEDYFEAAAIDGAGEWKKFIYITLPQLRPAMLSTGIILTVWTFLVFDIIYTMTGGGPGTATRILPLAIQRELITMYDTGAASALSLVSIVILTVLTVLYWRAMEGDESRP